MLLAPMQGLTNDALRACFIEHYQPDIVCTEFIRVQSASRKRVMRSDVNEIKAHSASLPLIVQLIGSDAVSLADAARVVQDAGAEHINLNLGCPYGRMTSGATGGELLADMDRVAQILAALRPVVCGSFSVKCRSGHSDPAQIHALMALFEESGVDFVILHPRTVAQRYCGQADHALTAQISETCRLPLLANGDINSATTGCDLLDKTNVAGLMLGRGALADAGLFRRIKEGRDDPADEGQRRRDVALFVRRLLPGYQEKFCGERQTLMKLKDILNFIPDESLQRDLKRLKRATSINRFEGVLEKHFS